MGVASALVLLVVSAAAVGAALRWPAAKAFLTETIARGGTRSMVWLAGCAGVVLMVLGLVVVVAPGGAITRVPVGGSGAGPGYTWVKCAHKPDGKWDVVEFTQSPDPVPVLATGVVLRDTLTLSTGGGTGVLEMGRVYIQAKYNGICCMVELKEGLCPMVDLAGGKCPIKEEDGHVTLNFNKPIPIPLPKGPYQLVIDVVDHLNDVDLACIEVSFNV